MTETSTPEVQQRLLAAITPHVPFEGWSAAGFAAAIADSGTDPGLARAVCPRGAVDLALAYHDAGDAALLQHLRGTDLSGLRYRDRIAAAVRFRLEASDRELVRRASTLFALPTHAADGARALWQTADAIWSGLGDASQDVNWYSKRATLAAVYGATLLYWLGDDSPGQQRSWRFLDRRIDDVMQIETLKAKARASRLLKPLLAGPGWLLGHIRAPQRSEDLPGRWTASE